MKKRSKRSERERERKRDDDDEFSLASDFAFKRYNRETSEVANISLI